MRLADEWDAIAARRGAEAAPAIDAWSRIEARRAADIIAQQAPDAWSQIETRRAAEAVSHAKTGGTLAPLLLLGGGLFLLLNMLKGRAS